MASGKNKKDATNITRITASDSSVKKESTPKKSTVSKKKKSKGFFKKLGDYFKGSWQELKKVQWPNRKATWSLTLAVLVFTAFFMVVILLIDVLFQELFNIILAR